MHQLAFLTLLCGLTYAAGADPAQRMHGVTLPGVPASRLQITRTFVGKVRTQISESDTPDGRFTLSATKLPWLAKMLASRTRVLNGAEEKLLEHLGATLNDSAEDSRFHRRVAFTIPATPTSPARSGTALFWYGEGALASIVAHGPKSGPIQAFLNEARAVARLEAAGPAGVNDAAHSTEKTPPPHASTR